MIPRADNGSGIDSKLPSVGTTIFTVMSRLAAECNAINLSQGFPDFDCDPALVEAVATHMRSGQNQYAPMQGLLRLRAAIAAKYEWAYGRRYDPETEVTVTSGGTEAIFDAVMAAVGAGDEVVVLEPCYDSYVPAIEMSGGTPVFVPLRFPEYSIDWDAVRQAITPRTRMIMLNSPHNPTGAVLTPADMAALAELVAGTRILILSDEVYEHIIFDGVRHESCAGSAALSARAFIVGSFGKTYHTTGWKVGYAVAPAALMAEFRKVHQFVTFSTNTPVQHAIADFLETRRGLAELGPFFQAKRDLFLRLMAGSRFRPLACHGSYFQLMDYSAITGEPDAEFAIRLTKEHGVAAIPTSPFLRLQPAPPVLRFCFAKRDDTLERAAARLQRV
jgi:methionine aminotransferase